MPWEAIRANRARAMTIYCEIAAGDPFHGPYHDREYGFPIADDDALFERLVLEINQAGLSVLADHPEEAGKLPRRL
jgi:DNA-3-methyladenine glycosylase I